MEHIRNWIIFLSELENRKSQLRHKKHRTWGSCFWGALGVRHSGCHIMGIESRSATIYLGSLGQTYHLGSHSVTLSRKGKELSGVIFKKSNLVLNAIFLLPLIIPLQTLTRVVICSPWLTLCLLNLAPTPVVTIYCCSDSLRPWPWI